MSVKGRRTADYDFELPESQIAQHPTDRRDASRLLVVDRASGGLTHRSFADIVALVRPGDVLVLNETRVFPARLLGRKTTGAAAEVLLLRPMAEPGGGLWQAIVRPGAKLKAGAVVEVGPELSVAVLDALPTGERVVRLDSPLPVDEALDRYGRIPLPPYVRRDADAADRDRYQTVYARESGSVAAPTAGLHFTPALLAALERGGVAIARLVLHVGIGTFRPVEVDDPAQHRMHAEWYSVGEEAAARINSARAAGGAVWAVGTTSVRTLESVADTDGRVRAGQGWTDIFIHPPRTLRAVDRMITNFHLPRSTLLMLVASFAGYDLTMRAYAEAVQRGYRFYSFGDAMAIV
jgi:S-adenosylmethionine:tRNA ribosyltransferase-isomerase